MGIVEKKMETTTCSLGFTASKEYRQYDPYIIPIEYLPPIPY